ncbi:MAG TPA: vitamin K epoxide reductase family protein [Thermoplasmata archaeon]|nr:vitamin K epoxide reductase family protein [Thermoplasmata archaeon]
MADARVLHRLVLAFILAGLALSLYATAESLNPALQGSCTVNAFLSCAAVQQSGLTTLGPVPDWALGTGGFALLLALDVLLIRTYESRWLLAVLFVAALGLGVAVVLGYIELALIHALCPVCLGTYVADLGAFSGALALLRLRRAATKSPGETASLGDAEGP